MQRFQRSPSFAAALTIVASWLMPRPLAAQAPPQAQASPSAASPVSLAERYAEEAFLAYGRQDYARAVALYHQALEAAPSADIVYNLARVYDLGLRDRSLAMRFYARYLDDPGAVPSRIDTSRQRLAELGAAGQAPTSPAPARPVAASPPSTDVATSGGSAAPAFAIAAGALGLVGVGVGVGFGITAKSHLDVSRRYCDDNACTTVRGVDAARSAARAADVATVGFVAGGGLLALGTVLWLIADGEADSVDAPRELEWTPRITPGEVSLALTGSFAGP